VLSAAALSGAHVSAAQVFEEGRFYRGTAFRVLQNYHLAPTDIVREATVIYGDATIEGGVDWNLQVYFGNVRLAPTAVVRGTVVVVAGDITIEEGATIRHDLVVVGGVVNAPATFTPGGGFVGIGDRWVGQTMRSVMPWVTRGLLWGRVIVPGLWWVWSVLFVFFVLTLAVNLLLHGPVGATATNLRTRPFSAFTTGLLTLLLAGPVTALLAATVVGIAIIPFFLCALLLAWIVGKVGVLRWIGRAIFTHGETEESRLQAMFHVTVGFVAISLLYMIPVVGLVTWAMVGVLGLGAATQHFLSALRRERPAKPPKAPKPGKTAPLATPVEPPSTLGDAPFEMGASAGTGAPLETSAGEDPHIYGAPPPYAPPPSPPPIYAPGDWRAYPKASFLDRLAALALDVILVAIVTSFFFSTRRTFDDEPFFPMLFIAYSILFWTWQATTLGGIVTNTRIVRADGRPLEFVDAVVRGLGGVLSLAAFGIGFLWILRDPQQQGWHDKIAGTIVVKVPKGTELR
jgi:uncharacterized RDD family membrane protein YckC